MGGAPPRPALRTARPAVVVLTGAESTGKTTLAERLAARYRVPWAREFVREFADAKASPLDSGDVASIARGQIALEDRVLAEGTAAGARLVILDTDLLSTAVYARHYYRECPLWVERAVRERRAQLYLLCHPDVPWIADPQRDRPHARDELHALFAAKLAELGAHWVDVRGDWDERERRAFEAVNAFCRER